MGSMLGTSGRFDITGNLIAKGGDEFARQMDRAGKSMQQAGNYAAQAQKSMRLFAVSLVGHRIGAALTAMGRAVVNFTKESVQMAFDWETSMRKVRTQTDLSATAFNRVSRAALRVASELPFAFDDVSQSLYDIYSGTNIVGKRAIGVLRQVGAAAVAGGAQMSTATDAVIGGVNAFKLGVKDIPHLLDLQFQLVRRAKGDYEDYANALNNAYPSAVRFGQSLETTFAAIAFASKGAAASPSQAIISVARAMDQLGRSKNAAAMVRELGVSVYDAQGQTRPMIDILEDMAGALDGLTAEQRAQKLYEVFGVGGIQAGRFLNRAIPGIKQLRAEFEGFNDVQGLVNRSFEIMVKENPEMALKILTNRATGLRTEFAARLFPAIQDIIGVFDRLLDIFDRMSPGMQSVVAKTIAFGGVLLLVTGRLFTFTASLAGARSMMELAGLTWGGVTKMILKDIALMAARFVLIVAAIAAIVVAIKLMREHWDQAKHVVAVLGALALVVFRTQIAGAIQFAIFAMKYYTVTTAGAIIPTGGLAAAARGLGLAIKSALGPFALILIGVEALMFVFDKANERAKRFASGVDRMVSELDSGKTSVASMRKEIERLNDVIASEEDQGLLGGTWIADKLNALDDWIGRLPLLKQIGEAAKEAEVAGAGDALDDAIYKRDQYTAALERHARAQRAMTEQAQRLGLDTENVTVKSFRKAALAARENGESVKKLRQEMQVFAGMTMDEMGEWKKSVTDSLDLVGNALSGLGDDAKVTADKFITQMKKQIEAARNFLRNIRILARRGLTEESAAALAAMGVQGQLIVADAAKNGELTVDQLNNVFKVSANLTDSYAARVIAAVQGVRNKTGSDLDAAGEKVKNYAKMFSFIPRNVTTNINLTNMERARAMIDGLQGALNNLEGTRAPIPGRPPKGRADHEDWRGGMIREPVFGVGARSGETYSFAERGPERVVPMDGSNSEQPIHVEQHFYNSRVDAAEAINELDWLRRTSPWSSTKVR